MQKQIKEMYYFNQNFLSKPTIFVKAISVEISTDLHCISFIKMLIFPHSILRTVTTVLLWRCEKVFYVALRFRYLFLNWVFNSRHFGDALFWSYIEYLIVGTQSGGAAGWNESAVICYENIIELVTLSALTQ